VNGSSRITAALCAIALAACAAKHPPAAADASTDGYFACSLLTPSEVGAALGVPVLHEYRVPPNRCEYRGKGPLESIFVEASQTGADAQFEGEKLADTLMGVSQAKSDVKIGDDSQWEAMGTVLYARKGDAYVGIDMRAAAVKTRIVGPHLATLALSRIH